MLRCLSLFSGIGGFDLAATACGFEIAAFCEIDPFCQAVLRTHWPDIPLYGDIKEISYARLAQDGLLPIELVYGGVPCQPASLAGKRQGSHDARWLWPQFLRVVGEVRPRWCVAENPVGILSIDARRAWGDILGSLVEMGYCCGWGVWAASDVGAPHRRERVFLVGYCADTAVADTGGHRRGERTHQPERQSSCGPSPDAGLDGAHRTLADAAGQGLEKRTGIGANSAEECPPTQRTGNAERTPNTVRAVPECRLGGVPDGISAWVEYPRWPAGPSEVQTAWEPPRTVGRGVDPYRRKRLHALGNAVVPAQIAPLFRASAEAEAHLSGTLASCPENERSI
jgi:DNA (cytosine-5)-methyltransferase 1